QLPTMAAAESLRRAHLQRVVRGPATGRSEIDRLPIGIPPQRSCGIEPRAVGQHLWNRRIALDRLHEVVPTRGCIADHEDHARPYSALQIDLAAEHAGLPDVIIQSPGRAVLRRAVERWTWKRRVGEVDRHRVWR